MVSQSNSFSFLIVPQAFSFPLLASSSSSPLSGISLFSTWYGYSWTGTHPSKVSAEQGQEEKRVIEDEMVGWHHGLNGHECEQALGNSEGQGRLACCSPWGHRESDTT